MQVAWSCVCMEWIWGIYLVTSVSTCADNRWDTSEYTPGDTCCDNNVDVSVTTISPHLTSLSPSCWLNNMLTWLAANSLSFVLIIWLFIIDLCWFCAYNYPTLLPSCQLKASNIMSLLNLPEIVDWLVIGVCILNDIRLTVSLGMQSKYRSNLCHRYRVCSYGRVNY